MLRCSKLNCPICRRSWLTKQQTMRLLFNILIFFHDLFFKINLYYFKKIKIPLVIFKNVSLFNFYLLGSFALTFNTKNYNYWFQKSSYIKCLIINTQNRRKVRGTGSGRLFAGMLKRLSMWLKFFIIWS